MAGVRWAYRTIGKGCIICLFSTVNSTRRWNSNSFPAFKEAMYETLKDFPYPRVVADVKIVSSQLQDAGLLGASALLG